MKKKSKNPRRVLRLKHPTGFTRTKSHGKSTEHKLARVTEEQFRRLVESVEEYAIYVLDPLGNVTTWNSGAQRIKGYTAKEIIGKNFACFYTDEDVAANKPQQNLEQTRKHGHIREEGLRVRKDGSTFQAEVVMTAMHDKSGNIIGFSKVTRDITERKRAENESRAAKEEAERANKAKSEFLSRMSHELRTPLNAILGFGQLLERRNPTPDQQTHIRQIMKGGRYLLALINEVLDISRTEMGHLRLSPEPVCLADALAEALDLMRPLAAERAIELTMPSPVERDCFVRADQQRFKQVLLNVISNAVKYTPIKGRVTISYSSPGKETVRIAVSDTGAGIPADKLARLFTPFDRLGAEQSNVNGMGLGLALCQRLMHAMGGSIGASSTPGQGSTFWIEIPRTESRPKKLTAPVSDTSERKRPSFTRKRKILYVEDNLSNLTLIEEILAEHPEIELVSAMQGRLGLDLARKHLPDLILLDLHLPDLAGSEVLSRLQYDEATRHIPVVVISADATPRQNQRLMAAGASAYLTKPINVPEFFEVFDRLLMPS